MKKTLKIVRYTAAGILAFLLLVSLAIQTDMVQNWLIKGVTRQLSQQLGTRIEVGRISISLFDKLDMEKTLILDQKKDTLLYAGVLKLRITDWFFLRKHADLKYIGLEDAKIHLNRSDSLWNYQFILNHFKKSQPSKNKKSSLELNLKKIDLKNVVLIKNDRWKGEKIAAAVGSLFLNADSIDFKKEIIAIRNLDLDQPTFIIQKFPGNRPEWLKPKNTQEIAGMPKLNPDHFAVFVRRITISGGTLSIQANTNPVKNHFDGKHLYITDIKGRFSHTYLFKDTIKSRIRFLAAKERSGLEIKDMKCKFKVSPELMEFDSLNLHTGHSFLSDYYAMHFNHFNADFGEYVRKVIMVARFKSAHVSSDDIAYFTPKLSHWNKDLYLSGIAKGTVANFYCTHITAKSGKGTTIKGYFAMKGLPHIDQTFITLKEGNIETTPIDASRWIKALGRLHSININALGNTRFSGNFQGKLSDFQLAGVFYSRLGTIKTNLLLKVPEKGQVNYQAMVNSYHFNLGKFLNISAFDHLNFSGKLYGSNTSQSGLDMHIEGKATKIRFGDYVYQNVTTKAELFKSQFIGQLKIEDPSLRANGQLDISLKKQHPVYNLIGDIAVAHLKPLGFTKDSIDVSGMLDMNYTGANIDGFLGKIKLFNAQVSAPSRGSVSFDSLCLSSWRNQYNVHFLKVENDDFNALISGNFNVMRIPDAIKVFLNKYYPAYFNPVKGVLPKQDFILELHTFDIEPYLKLFLGNISGFNDASLTGGINSQKNIISFSVNLQQAGFKGYTLSSAEVSGIGNDDSIRINGKITQFLTPDSLTFPSSVFAINAGHNLSRVVLHTGASNTMNSADIDAQIYTLNDGIEININPSSFVLNEKKWNLEKSGHIAIRKDEVSAQNVQFTQGFQSITVETENQENTQEDESKTKGLNNLVIKFDRVLLGDITGLLRHVPKMEGLLDGEIRLRDFFGNFNMDATMKVDQFRFNDDSLGVIYARGNFDEQTGEVPFRIESSNPGYAFNASGDYNTKDSSAPLHAQVILDSMNIRYLNHYLDEVFSKVDGFASGNLSLSGQLNAPDIEGNVKIKKGKLRVKYTQVPYSLDSANIAFEKDGINFNLITFRDSLNNQGTISGKLYEKGMKNMVFDFRMQTNRLILINTHANDNAYFYGWGIGKADLRITGPENNCQMSIDAEASDSSHIYVTGNSSSRGSTDADFITFKQYGIASLSSVQPQNSNKFNMDVNLNMKANKNIQIDLILDPLSGDVIQTTGNGNLLIQAGTRSPFRIRGRYNIDQGNYSFNFQSFIRKPFILTNDGNNYIEWSGSPMNAILHISATYTAENVSVSDLVSSQQFTFDNTASKAYRGPVYVTAQLTGKLSKPDISFKLDFPQSSPLKSDATFIELINKIEKDDNEILKQVTYLIAFNTFAPYGELSAGSNLNVASVSVNTISGMLTAELNKAVSNLLFRLTHDRSLQFDVGTSVYNSSSLLSTGTGNNGTSNNFDRSRINFKMSYNMFNDKLLISFGGDFDFNVGAAAQSGNLQWLPDLNIEYYITRDKKLRAIIFSKNSLDISSGSTFGKRSRQGVGISYKKDFEKLFGKKEDDDLNIQSEKK